VNQTLQRERYPFSQALLAWPGLPEQQPEYRELNTA
jgi:hypothetical protein